MIRVLHVPTNVGGNPYGLSQALLAKGIVSRTWVLYQYYFDFKNDRLIWRKGDGLIGREIKRLVAIFQAAFGYDIIHFNFGSSLANPISPLPKGQAGKGRTLRRWIYSIYTDWLQIFELTLYRCLGRRLFVHFQGDDARQGEFQRTHFVYHIASQVGTDYYNETTDRFKRRIIRRLADACDVVYALNPDLLHVLPPRSRFLPYSHIRLNEWWPEYPAAASQQPLRIGHAPTNRAVKGTALITAALNHLREKGYRFEFILIEGLPQSEAKLIYAKLDIVVDQLFAGWYGGLAVEAMALGKPVVTYIREQDLVYIPPKMRDELPLICATPDNIEAVLRDVLDMPRIQLHMLGRRARAYVENWHDPAFIADIVQTDYYAALACR